VIFVEKAFRQHIIMFLKRIVVVLQNLIVNALIFATTVMDILQSMLIDWHL